MGLGKKKYPDGKKLVIKALTPNDVLFGRGGLSNHNPGNRRYQKVIEDMSVMYLQCSRRKEKTELSWKILRELRKQGVRFLRPDSEASSVYVEVNDDDIRKKISQRLRERAFEKKAEANEEKAQADIQIPGQAAQMRSQPLIQPAQQLVQPPRLIQLPHRQLHLHPPPVLRMAPDPPAPRASENYGAGNSPPTPRASKSRLLNINRPPTPTRQSKQAARQTEGASGVDPAGSMSGLATLAMAAAFATST